MDTLLQGFSFDGEACKGPSGLRKAKSIFDNLCDRGIISAGEDGTHQFKANIHNGDSLASEMVSFSNSEGGTLFLGVADNGSIPGLTKKDVARINQLISNTASQQVRSPKLYKQKIFSYWTLAIRKKT